MDGRPLREHLEAAYRQTGKLPALLADAPRLPMGTEALWRDFLSLHASRGSNGFGLNRIGYLELDAYQRVHGFRFEPWQIDAIQRADAAFITAHAAANKPKTH